VLCQTATRQQAGVVLVRAPEVILLQCLRPQGLGQVLAAELGPVAGAQGPAQARGQG